MKVRLLATALVMLAVPAQAAVTKFVVETRTPYAADAKFETLTGHFDGVLDPADPHNSIITDIALAARNAQGKVAYSATFQLIKPVDMSKSTGLLFYQVVNRGHATPIYFPEGHVGVQSGWQGDLPNDPQLFTIQVPTAHNADGSAILSRAYARIIDLKPGTKTIAIKGGASGGEGGRNFEPATAEGAELFTTTSDTSAPVTVPHSEWALGDCATTPFPGTPDITKLCLKNGFDPKLAYTLSFLAKDPKVLGIGFAATRDLVAFLRYADKDAAGNPNPVAHQLRRAVAAGRSQSGNFLRSLVHLGFNATEQGRIVFDGLQSIIAPRQVALNVRFTNAGGAAAIYEPGSDGPVWWTTHDGASLLDRCHSDNTCPKIIEEFGAAEFWNLRASPDFVGTDAKADLPLPANVRRYYYPSVTHGGGSGSYDLASYKPVAACKLDANPNPTFAYRASQKALADWVLRGTEPPPSRYPTLAKGDLVAPNAQAMGFPTIPGQPAPDGHFNPFLRYDFGNGFNATDISGVPANQPARITGTRPSLVPRVNQDGNEMAGVASPMLQAPLGSYLGWNIIAAGFEAGQHCSNQGGFIPFAATKAERLAKADPRPSLEERYGTHANYVAKVKAAADKLVAERYLLPGDAAATVASAQAAKLPLP